MVRLKPLKQGSLIRMVSPASPVPEEKLANSILLLESWGFRVELGKNALKSEDYLAGTDKERSEDLMEAVFDRKVDAIFCTRGGYGCARLLSYLDIEAFLESRKPLFGFSDVTTLHLALNGLGMPTFHAPMALTLHSEREPWVYESLKRSMMGDLTIPEDAPRGLTIFPGIAEGRLIGGCLCLLTDSIGTPYGLKVQEQILLIEDVDENPHRIDAMLTHLENAGILEKCLGFVIGEMTRTDEKVDETIGGRPWREIVKERLLKFQKPTIFDYPFGHAKSMLTIPLGLNVRLDANLGTLTVLESPFE